MGCAVDGTAAAGAVAEVVAREDTIGSVGDGSLSAGAIISVGFGTGGTDKTDGAEATFSNTDGPKSAPWCFGAATIKFSTGGVATTDESSNFEDHSKTVGAEVEGNCLDKLKDFAAKGGSPATVSAGAAAVVPGPTPGTEAASGGLTDDSADAVGIGVPSDEEVLFASTTI